MKKIITLTVLCLMALGLWSQTVTFTHTFGMPELVATDDGYTDIRYPECLSWGDEGTPLMPYLCTDLLLPWGTEGIEIRIISVDYYKPFHDIVIRPAERQFPISLMPEGEYKVEPDPGIYSSREAYPAGVTDNLITHFLQGHSIGSFTICPVRFTPAEKTIQCIRQITVEVRIASTDRSSEAASFLRTGTETFGRIQRIVENTGGLETYMCPEGKAITEYDILLISNNALLPSFANYISYKTSTGFIVKTMSVEDIYATYTGTDNQTKIRNCIIDYYQNWGISYVILGGDTDPNNPADRIIPHRGMYGNAYSTPETDIPADIYYSNLDGNWNSDGDTRYGEPGEEDLYSEVSIGRICIDGTTEIQNFTQKLQKYQDAPVVADIEKALMVGELLWNDPTWGGDYKDEVAYGSSNHGYTTAGLSPNFTITRLYEKLGNWSKTDIFNQFNNVGVNLLNHLGHSNVNYNMKMYNTDLTTSNFTNNGVTRGYVITYSQGCYNGSFDNRDDANSYSSDDCFNEKFSTLLTGAVACIGNSRYGWGMHSSTDGASQYFDRQFYDAMFGENITKIGDANRDSKEDNAANISSHSGAIRWCYYEINLFGDPTMDIWTALPTNINATYPPSVPLGATQVSFQTDAPYARIGLMQNGILIGRAVADASGDATVIFFDPVAQVSDISVSIIAHNRNRHQGTIVVISNQPYVIYNDHQVHDASGNGNGIPEFGEAITLDMELKNVGSVTATAVNATLATADPYVTVTDGTEYYGDMAPAQAINKTNAFGFTIADLIPDGHTVTFDVSATGQSTWNSFFSIDLHAPVLQVGNMTIDDAAGGNGNGMLDPGETATIHIETSNTGSAASPSCTGVLTTGSPWITINNGTSSMGSIGAGATVQANFQITVDAGTPIGTSVDLVYNATAGSYTASKTFYKSVGLVLEDWETGTMTKFEWETGGSAPWSVVTQSPWEGIYCCKSGAIGHNQTTSLAISFNVTTAGTISFYRKVSSETAYDYLRFYIDGVQQGQWAGEVSWGQATYPVTAGNHTFQWSYVKDANTIGGSDCAWVDYIIFPPVAPETPVAVPYSTNFDLGGALPEGWKNGMSDDFDWTPLSGSTPSSSTGPSGDHTSGSGYYVYTEASSPNYPSKRADLVTPKFDLTTLSDAQVTFWYHMYGAAMGVLHLDVYDNGAWINDVMTPISGNQGNAWYQKTADLTAFAGKHVKLRFRGITGTNYTSDMAVDDFQITGTLAPMVQLDLKAFLQGPFSGTTMNTFLNIYGYIPASQPYNMPPYNYNGTETASPIPNADVTDWVLIELRETTGPASTALPSTMVGRQAGFILKNGSIVAADGSSLMEFDLTITGNLFVVIWHRNHLGVMSSDPLSKAGNIYSYDYTTGSTKVYGGMNGHREIAPGIWGMIAGDGDCDGQVTSADKVEVWIPQSGSSGYLQADFNLNGNVENGDKIECWGVNAGMGCQVPE
ncbi:MAG: hypothetical protein JW861_03600 [Bacteroidales bacterium]|nr:hypothetical protein [Bacteroidales bacterium]